MKHELLAPAGNLSIFYAVVNAGANAVYVGGPKFGARAYAKNFTTEELIEAITYAHLHQVKVYMTVNTLIKENELAECIEMMIPFYKAGLDGVILQDMGVFRAFREHFPNMELHASTQMSVSNVHGAKLLKEAGIVRIVPSRELSLEEIKRIHEEADIEIESFIHGALCYCYSGQCLMSSFIGGRSGNRGRCAQPCRLPYEVYDSETKRIRESGPILSLKDLCTITFLPQLLDAGIFSLKIEGRMKQASYAYTVVSIYRKYLDYYEANGAKGYEVSRKDIETLLAAGNRDGFTDGYYFRHNGKEMLTTGSASHASSDGALDEATLCAKKKIAIHGTCSLRINKPVSLQIYIGDQLVTIEGDVVQEATSKGMTQEQVHKQLSKTGTSDFEWSSLDVEMESQVFLPVSSLNQLRRTAFSKITDLLTFRRTYVEPEDSTNRMPLSHKGGHVSVLVRTIPQLRLVLSKEYITRIYLEVTTLLPDEEPEVLALMQDGIRKGRSFYLAMPYVFRKDNEVEFSKQWNYFSAVCEGVLARSYDGLAYAKSLNVPIVSDSSLYVMNQTAQDQFREYGVQEMTMSVELHKREMVNLEQTDTECIAYGRIPMMISAGCVYKNTKNCKKQPGMLYLKDRKGYVFPVRNECRGCYNVMYNSTPTCIFAKSGETMSGNIRLQFSTETDNEVKQVLSIFEQNVLGTPGNVKLDNFTWGHYKRGVE